MKTYLVTGVSGCGRVELLEELRKEMEEKGAKVVVINVGEVIVNTAVDLGVDIPEPKILDMDRTSLRLLREIALLKTQMELLNQKVDYCFIGIHATFRWRGQLIDGINYRTLKELNIDGLINVVDTIQDIIRANKINPKWKGVNELSVQDTNNWLIEEDFVTYLLASFLNRPMITIGRKHTISNLADSFLTKKKSVYLSYPITHIKKEDPEFEEKINKEILPALEKHFVVFNPLVIKDIEKAKRDEAIKVSELSKLDMDDIGQRTVSRDYRFIDQSNFVIAIYKTEKLSPGVLSELFYANSHGKNTFVVFPYPTSPFLDQISTVIFKDVESLFDYLQKNDYFLS